MKGSMHTAFWQTASEHYLPLWGMKPTLSEQHNLLDLHTLILTH
jgi:hypothetical protein